MAAPPLTYQVTRLARAIGRNLDSMRSGSLTGPQVAALIALRAEPGLTSAQLARRCYVTPQSMGEVVIQLEESGLLRRTPHGSHGRKLITALTPAGKKILSGWDVAITGLEERLLAGFSEAEIDRFSMFLDRCIENAAASEFARLSGSVE